jgi:esterase
MEFHYRSWGKGHPLIILHGLFGSLDNWATMAKALAGEFHVFAYDARNHGRSFHSGKFSYGVMADDIGTFMDQRGISSAYLLGHSMGGKSAMQFALTHPDRVDRLIVVDIAPRSYARKHDELIDAMMGLDLSRYSLRQEVDAALAGKIQSTPTRLFLLKNLARNEDGTLRWKLNLQVIRRHYGETAKGVTARGRFEKRALFIKGGKSPYITPDDRPLIKKLFPHASLLTIKKAGHWVHADAPEEIVKVVRGFLRTGHPRTTSAAS